MELCTKLKSVKQTKICFIFNILQVATFCFDDSFAHFWHSLNQFHEVDTWNGFQPSGVPCQELLTTVLICIMVRNITTSTVERRLCESGLHG